MTTLINLTKAGIRLILLAALLLSPGCASLGTRRIKPDRYGYSKALSDSWKTQALLNIVRLRYADAPTFVDVTQIIAGYSVEHTGRVGAGFGERIALPGWSHKWDILAQTKYTDRPTITYRPLTGAEFTRSLMTPIPPHSLIFLIQSGFPSDRVMGIGIHRINGLDNRLVLAGEVTPPEPEFVRLIFLLRDIQKAGVLGMRVEKSEKEAKAFLVFQEEKAAPEIQDEIDEAKKLLGLSPDLNKYRITFGGIAQSDKEISIQSRSILRILANMASYVQVPPEDIEEGRAWAPPESAGITELPFQIHSGTDVPSDAFASVRYRGKWYWIDDTDLSSKRILSFMTVVFAVSQPSEEEIPTVVTVSAN